MNEELYEIMTYAERGLHFMRLRSDMAYASSKKSLSRRRADIDEFASIWKTKEGRKMTKALVKDYESAMLNMLVAKRKFKPILYYVNIVLAIAIVAFLIWDGLLK